jgi:putative hydrolase of the HAD superfamily
MRFPELRAVLFDAYGTVLLPEPTMAAAYTTVGRQFGSVLDEAEVRTRFRRASDAEDAIDVDVHRGRTGEPRERLRWLRIVIHVFSELEQPKPLFNALWDYFGAAENWRVLPGVAEAWEAIEGRDLTIGVASNFDRRLEGICRSLAPLDRTPHVFASSQLGWRKPTVEFFRAIENRLQLRPEQLLLVGDDLENDYRAARSAGWNTVLVGKEPLATINDSVTVADEPAAAQAPEPSVDRISSLHDLTAWLF